MTRHVARPDPVRIEVNGQPILAYEGESLATALLAAGYLVHSRDRSGRARSPFCNMGVCFDCLVALEDPAESGASAMPGPARVRACMTPIRSGLRLRVPEP